MGLPRSTYYDAPPVKTDDAEIVANITAICDEFEAYGYRRVGAELRHRRMIVNSKKIRRLMREHNLQPKRRRRFVATTDSDTIIRSSPDLARGSLTARTSSGWQISPISRSQRGSSIWPQFLTPGHAGWSDKRPANSRCTWHERRRNVVRRPAPVYILGHRHVL